MLNANFFSIASSVPVKPVFSVPFQRDNEFIDRKSIFSQIEEKLQTHHQVSLFGIGGIGKSQIAIENAYRILEKKPRGHVFWIFVASFNGFVQAYQDISRRLKLPGCNNAEIDQCKLVSEWLDEDGTSQWLMIVDNADNTTWFFPPTDLNESSVDAEATQKFLIDYLPKKLNSRKSLIITTRSRHISEGLVDGESSIEVLPFMLQEARDLLRAKAKGAVDISDTSTIERLLNVLGCIPLAISQAAAFMKRNRISVQKYLAALEKDEQNLVNHLSIELLDRRRECGFPNSIFRTWKLSFDQIRRERPRATEILSLMTMLDRQRIPESLLQRPGGNDADFTMAMGTLEGFSLITRELEDGMLGLHRLVQLSVHNWLEQEDKKMQFTEQALQIVAEEFPFGSFENREKCQSLLPHALAVLQYHQISEFARERRASLVYNIGRFYLEQGLFENAHEKILESYDIYRQVFGEDSKNTFRSLNALAVVLDYQGKDEASEETHRRALKGYENLLGVEHLETLTSFNNLAIVFCSRGKYEKAKKMHRRALKKREKILGAEHPDTLNSVNCLATVFCDQGKYEEAEKMHHRALKGYEKLLGIEHQKTMSSVYGLALLYHTQKKYENADVYYQRAIAGFSKILKSDHPTLVRCSNDHSLMLREMENQNKDRDQREDKDHQEDEGRRKDGSQSADDDQSEDDTKT